MVEVINSKVADGSGVILSSKSNTDSISKIALEKSAIDPAKDCECRDIENGYSKRPKEADFEEAIAAAGFGKFNLILLLCALPGFSTSVYVTSSLSYIMTSAECDLQMDMVDMGRLNIITYSGMMASAILWGFLSDTLGRKKIMVWGFLALSLCELAASQSQVYWMLVVSKFMAGFIFNGPFAVLISYISELHAASMRAKVIVYIGAFYSFGNMNLPLLAWGVIPHDFNISILGGAYVFHSWHIFLALFSIPPLISGLAIALLPESPKFLMSRGRNDEALRVFKRIFSINTGLPPDQYPILRLVEENAGKAAPRGIAALVGGCSQLKPLALPPHLPHIILICLIQAAAMLGSNTLRLWFPQLATIIEDYEATHAETAPLCRIISHHVSNKTVAPFVIDDPFFECVTLETGTSTYVNSVIIGLGSLIAYLAGGVLINKVGKRKLAAIGLLMSGLCGLAVFWSSGLPEIVALFTVCISVSGVSAIVLSTITVDMFPTSIRAMAVAILMMSGRMGTVLGGFVFPHLLTAGCLTPFVFLGLVMITGGFLCFLLPKTTLKKLE